MANVCMFDMKIVADTKENLEEFINALTQKENIWMGRGAIICAESPTDKETIKIISGEVKWSIYSALIICAYDMRKKPSSWADIEGKEIISIEEASSRYNVDVEIYSEEWDLGFEEHLLIKKGKTLIDDEVDTDDKKGFKKIWNI